MKTDITKRVETARARLMLKAPFYSVLAMKLPLTETREVRGFKVDTFATDGKAIYFNPEYAAGLTIPQTMGALADEVNHCARGDQFRRKNRDRQEWNISTDIRNARSILAAGLELPPGAVGAEIARANPELAKESAERIYAIRAREAQEAAQKAQETQDEPEAHDEPDEGDEAQPGQDEAQDGESQDEQSSGDDEAQSGEGDESGEPGDEGEESSDAKGEAGDDESGEADAEGGSDGESEAKEGQGEGGEEGEGEGSADGVTPATGQPGAGKPAPQTFGEVLDYPGDEAERSEAEREWKMAVAQAAAIAHAHDKNAGRGAGAYAEIVEASQASTVDWRTKLRQFAADCTIRDTDWTRRSRRSHGAGFIWPGQTAIAPAHVVLVEDTSGSMDVASLIATRAEAQGMLDSRAVERITLIQCDDAISGVWEFNSGDVIEAPHLGRGGTSYSPAWRYIEDNCRDAACVVYLTDLFPNGNYFGEFDACPVLWAVPLANPAYRAFVQTPVPPFGETVPIDPWQ